MSTNRIPVEDYIKSKKNILNYFKCDGDYFVKPLIDVNWTIKGDDEYFILSYWTEETSKTDAVIVKKSGVPMIYKMEDYTMIVGIDCVKIAFIFHNDYRKIS